MRASLFAVKSSTAIGLPAIVAVAPRKRRSKAVKLVWSNNELSIGCTVEHCLPEGILGQKVTISNDPQRLSRSSQCDIYASKVLQKPQVASFPSPVGVK